MEQNEDALEYSSEDEKKDNLEDNLNKLKVGDDNHIFFTYDLF